jgi:hypothetical protein
LDIALLLKKHGHKLSAETVSVASAHWRTGHAVPFLLHMTANLLDAPLPRQLEACVAETAPEEAETAMTALFNLPDARERAGESTLMDFRQASAMGKLALAWRRVFMPRQFMLLDYPCARTRLGVPLAWLKRALRLYRRYRSLRAGALEKPALAKNRQEIARQRRQLAEKLLSCPSNIFRLLPFI